MSETTPTIQEQVQYIKLMKMTKGYNWEIKVLDKWNDLSIVLAKVEDLNNQMQIKFPSINDK